MLRAVVENVPFGTILWMVCTGPKTPLCQTPTWTLKPDRPTVVGALKFAENFMGYPTDRWDLAAAIRELVPSLPHCRQSWKMMSQRMTWSGAVPNFLNQWWNLTCCCSTLRIMVTSLRVKNHGLGLYFHRNQGQVGMTWFKNPENRQIKVVVWSCQNWLTVLTYDEEVPLIIPTRSICWVQSWSSTYFTGAESFQLHRCLLLQPE